MSYGTIKVDTITFTDNSVDKSVSLSGLIQNPTFTGNITVTGTISGDVIRGGTTVSGATVTGTTANFVSGVFTTQISGATVTGTTASFTSGVFTNISGTTATITSGIIASGTAAAPSLAILADLDTGLFSPGANQLAVATNGTGRLFINALGQVGVGTSSPSEPLDVVSASGTARAIRVRGRSADNIGLIDFYSSDNATRYATIGAGAANTFVVETANNERLRVDSSGRVGIGTSTPSALLHVSSTGAVESLLSGGGTSGDTVLHLKGNGNAYKFIVPNSAAQYGMGLYDVGNAAYRLYVTSAGNVGVGTTSPSLAFVVSNSGAQGFEVQKNSGTLSGGIELISYNRTTSAYSPVLYDASFHAFGISNSEKARIDSSGRVGIGTSSPSANLESQGNVSSTTQFSGFQGLRIQNANGSAFGVSADINFAAGTSTDNRGAVIGAVYESPSGGNALYFATNGSAVTSSDTLTERMRITSAGNVGIGTTSPTARFDVRREDTGGKIAEFHQSGGYGIDIGSSESVAYISSGYAQALTFKTDPSSGQVERARIDSSGRLLVGTSTARTNVRFGARQEEAL
jgi:hypothetical protein